MLAIGEGNSDGVAQMQHFVQQNALNMFRLPVTWQFLINSNNLNGTGANISAGTLATSAGQFSQVNMGQYSQLVRGCLATGSFCIIDVHNYARFEGQVIGQGGPTNAQFASMWSQIATTYRNESKVIFGIMNEPHDLPNLSMWADSVQAAVTAIRMAGATTQMILLPGTDFTHAQTYVENGSAGNLSRVHNPDGSNTSLIFDVHQYLDSDDSGTHLECVTDRVNDTFVPLAQFLRANGRKAMLTEIGGGNTTSVCLFHTPTFGIHTTDAERLSQCLTDLCNTLAFVNSASDVYLGYTGWSAGGFSATDYNLTMTPFGSAGNFTNQKIVQQCLVDTRTGVTAAAPKAPSAGSTNATVSPSSGTNQTQQGGLQVVTAGSTRLDVGRALRLGGVTAVLWFL